MEYYYHEFRQKHWNNHLSYRVLRRIPNFKDDVTDLMTRDAAEEKVHRADLAENVTLRNMLKERVERKPTLLV